MASKRYLYSDTIDNFLQKNTDTIVGEITLSATQDINKETSNSWQQEVEILKEVLAPYAQKGSVYFESLVGKWLGHFARSCCGFGIWHIQDPFKDERDECIRESAC